MYVDGKSTHTSSGTLDGAILIAVASRNLEVNEAFYMAIMACKLLGINEAPMSDPDKCDETVFKKGHSVAVLDACMYRAEQWVKSVAKESGQKVDWHYRGGRVIVLYLGDYNKVVATITKLTPELLKPMVKDQGVWCGCTGPMHGKCSIMGNFPAGTHGPSRDGDLDG